jgi:hypothetical protein
MSSCDKNCVFIKQNSRKNIYETLSSSNLTYSARTDHNFNIAVVPNTRGSGHACFLTDNSVLTKVDICIFVNKLRNISTSS